MTLYHLDRFARLTDDVEISLIRNDTLPLNLQHSSFLSCFPDGLSQHGWNHVQSVAIRLQCHFPEEGEPLIYLSSFVQRKSEVDLKIIETVFELVRQAHFPQMPSRLTSIFAVKDMQEFSSWPELSNKDWYPNLQIASLSVPDDTPFFDSNFLRGGISLTENENGLYMGSHTTAMYDSAVHYWSGASTAKPRWEYLIQASGLLPCILDKE